MSEASGPLAAGQGHFDKDTWKLLIACTAAMGVGMTPISMLPLLIGTWVDDLGASELRAGVIGAAEIGAIAVSALAIAPRVHTVPFRRIASICGAVAAASFVVSIGVRDLDGLLVVRIVGGLGEGVVLAVATAVVARSRDPERIYALAAVIGGIAATFVLVALPYVIDAYGTAGAFATLAALTGASLPFFAFLPNDPVQEPSRESEASGGGLWGLVAVALLLAGLLSAISQSGVWAFSELIGEAAAIPGETIGLVLGLSTLAGVAGGGLAGVLGTSRGRVAPIAIGYASYLTAVVLICGGAGLASFATGQLLFAFAFYFVTPYLIGLAAAIDMEGRLAAALSGATLVGAGLGPGVAGVVVEQASFWALGGVGVALTLVSALLLVPVMRSPAFRTPRVLAGRSGPLT